MKTLALALTALASAMVLVAAVASCASSAEAGPEGDKGTSVTVVHLGDGTRCAVMDKSGGAAIDCDWR